MATCIYRIEKEMGHAIEVVNKIQLTSLLNMVYTIIIFKTYYFIYPVIFFLLTNICRNSIIGQFAFWALGIQH